MRFLLAAGLLLLAVSVAPAADVRTPNFIVTAKTEELAKKVGEAAEKLRDEKALLWFGKKLPKWSEPTRLDYEEGGDLASSGHTSYFFIDGKIVNMTMVIKGTPDLAMKAVLPHEITHSVMVTHFGKIVPRWADEGMAQYEEPAEVRAGLEKSMARILANERLIPLAELFPMKRYPDDINSFYCGSYSITRFLVEKGGKEGRTKFLAFVKTGMDKTWTESAKTHYGYESIKAMQDDWIATIEKEDKARREKEKEKEKKVKEPSDARSRHDDSHWRESEQAYHRFEGCITILNGPLTFRD